MSNALSRRFLARTEGAGDAPEDFERELAALWNEGRAAWPELSVSAEDFADFLGSKLERNPSVTELKGLRAADLYLALGCLRGDAVAIAQLEQLVSGDLAAVFASIPAAKPHAEDLRQALLERVLVPAPGRDRPRMADYGGRGSLRSWLRVSLTRLALNLVERAPRESGAAELDGLVASAAQSDPELARMRVLYREALSKALAAAFRLLEPRERNLLRHRFVDGLRVDEIAAVHGHHRVTAARQLARARTHLMEGVRAELRKSLDLSSEEILSVVRLVRSDLDVSLRKLFASSISGERKSEAG